ncbi:RNA-binding domain-containing protein [Maribellus maritimus]|uniref:RNA-binding domain-containing protein n=1 Tax=Maribellus maritimus TaxID=2870838 RepID=UPI001EEBC47E|nr:RNA-binding domain-containing protein [Maribellus maritimus]MCG6188594.1 putative DNA binding domain-containing protein [Maribellus maritimus]
MEELLYKLLQSPVETEVLEFKEAKNQFDKDKLGKYFSALSNEANLTGKPEAWLLFGVNNDKNIIGTQISDKQLNEYKKEIATNTSPTLSFIAVHRVAVAQNNVLMFQIPAAPKGMPVAWKNMFYARDGESLTGLNINKIERIRNQQTNLDWSAEIVPDAMIKDLSVEAIKKAREQFAEKHPKLKDEIPTWDDITFLNKAKITINGQLTRTAILLLGNPESDTFINPASSKITWILRDRDKIEKDYEHFFCPLLLKVENVYAKIRNLKYRYLKSGTLFPDEVDQFEPYIIREALNNCIAHQDYTLGGKINVVEREDGFLTFSNLGHFIPESVESVITADAPEEQYRNPFLANAMVNLNLIDTIGSGIKKMFVIQKNKFFPLPEYNLENNKVTVTITGKVLDEKYAQKLALMPDLSLDDIILLDKVQKGKSLTDEEIKTLRTNSLIEGRKPNFHISSVVAEKTGQQNDYIRQKGIDDEYCKKIIIDYLEKFGEGRRSDFEEILLDKLPDILDMTQKKNKIKNNLQILKNTGIIEPHGKLWKMSNKG